MTLQVTGSFEMPSNHERSTFPVDVLRLLLSYSEVPQVFLPYLRHRRQLSG